MKHLACVLMVLLSTTAIGLQTQSLRGAGNHSAHLHMKGAKRQSPEGGREARGDLLSRLYGRKKEEAKKVTFSEDDEDLLADSDNNTLYSNPDSLREYTMSMEPNPSWEGKETLTRPKIKQLAREAQEDMAKDKDYTQEASDLFNTWTIDQEVVAKPEQMVNPKPLILRRNGTYRILETKFRNWAGVDIPGIEEAERLAAEKAIRDKLKLERWKLAKKRLEEKKRQDKKLKAELEAMSIDELKDQAMQMGALEEEIVECEQEKDPKKELMRLLKRYRFLSEQRKAREKAEVERAADLKKKEDLKTKEVEKKEAELKKKAAAEREEAATEEERGEETGEEE